MSKSNVVVQFHDFHVSQGTQTYINSLIQEIQHELPTGARVKATFTKKNDVVKGMLQVGSYAGPLFAVAASPNLNEVTVKLVEQVRRRIEKWKSKNHSRNSIKNMKLNEAEFENELTKSTG
jgi:hypothetical protein